MKNTSIILAALTMICCSPASKEHQTKGIVCDATMNTISIVTANKDTLSFSTLDADKSHVTGLLLNDTAEIFYKGKYTAGMSATKLIVYKNQALGALQTRTYEGILPAASCPGIRYSLTIQNQEHSGDGTFTLTMTYIEAENGKDAIFNYKGKRFTQRGDATNNDAIVWQLVADNGKDIFNFLREDEQTLTLLHNKFEKSETGLNYSLKLIEK